MDLMKQFHALVCISFSLLPFLCSAQDLATNNHDTNRQNAVAAAEPAHNHAMLAAETTDSRSDWSKEEDRVLGSISKSKLLKMKGVTNALVDFLKDTCIGEGVYNPIWHGEYFSGKNSPGAQLKFALTCHFPDQDAELSITANDVQPLLDEIVVNGQHYMTVRVPSKITDNGIYYADAADSGTGQTKMWLISNDKNRLPFIAVSRKEYLNQARAELMSMVNSIIAGWKMKVPVRPAAVQEAEKKASIEQLQNMYSGSDLDVRMRLFLENYKTDEDYLNENIQNETAAFTATIALMDSLLAHMRPAELAMPAVVSVNAADFHGFEDGQTNYMLARMNPTYFNSALSEEKPQLFLVTWHCDPSNPSTEVLDKELTEGIAGPGLQELLSK